MPDKTQQSVSIRQDPDANELGVVVRVAGTVNTTGGGGGGGRVTDLTQNGTITSNGQNVTITQEGSSGISLHIDGTWVAALQFQASLDGTNFFNYALINLGTKILDSTTVANGDWVVDGFKAIRVLCVAFTSGTVNIELRASALIPDLIKVIDQLAGGFNQGNSNSSPSQAWQVQVADQSSLLSASVLNSAPPTITPGLVVRAPDGGNVNDGATTDIAVVGDVTGTISAKLRGLSKIFNSVWDSVNNLLKIGVNRLNGNVISTNSGVTDAGTQRVVLPTDYTLPAGTNVIGHVILDTSGAVIGHVIVDSGHIIVDSVTGTVAISAVSLPLPTGAATAANQATEIASLANIDVPLSTRLKPADTLTKVSTVDTITNPIAVSSSALPTNAAQESAGNLDRISNANRLLAILASQQLQFLQVPPSGFVPIETPSFLIG